jgi:hypothetical protein
LPKSKDSPQKYVAASAYQLDLYKEPPHSPIQSLGHKTQHSTPLQAQGSVVSGTSRRVTKAEDVAAASKQAKKRMLSCIFSVCRWSLNNKFTEVGESIHSLDQQSYSDVQ